jgi:very-short-patch-repair endonuclease/glutathione peroxidase-family protein
MKIDGEGVCPTCGSKCGFLGLTYGYSKYCSSKCSNGSTQVQQKKKDSCRKNFGVDHPLQSKEIQKNFVMTSLSRNGTSNPSQSKLVKEKKVLTSRTNYGVDNPMQSKEIQKRHVQIMANRYGIEYPLQSKEFQIKRKETCKENLGVEFPLQSKELQNKCKETCKENLGVEFPMQSKEVQEKSKVTCKENYGVEYPSQSKEVQEKIRAVCKEKYGVEYPSQSKEVQEKIRAVCKEKYGVDHFTKTIEGKRRCRENFLNMIKVQFDNGEPLVPRIGNNERVCLTEFQKLISYSIIRNPKLIGYFPDGLIEQFKLIIEFDERYHFLDDYITYVEKDIYRKKELESMGYVFFRISEKDWKENKEEVIQNFLCVIKGLEDIKRLQDPSITN